MGKFAYCTLVMRGDKYIPGALITGYSLKLISSPDIDIIVMITSDVSKEAKNLLTKIFDRVILVEYIKYESKFPIIKTKEQKKRYSVWLADSYTKWNIINFIEYEKILLLDADTVIIRNIDDVFDFDTPAGVFDNPFSKSYGNRGFPDYYSDIKFGEKIPHANIYNGLNKKGNVVWATAILLSPNRKDFKDFHNMLSLNQPFGFNTHSGNDEQAITYFYYSKKKKWTLLPTNLNVIAWYAKMVIKPSKIPEFCKKKGGKKIKKRRRRIKKEFVFHVHPNSPFLKQKIQQKIRGGTKTKILDKCNLINCQVPHVVHYFGSEMVWEISPSAWPDTPVFWQFVYNLIFTPNKQIKKNDINKLKKIFNVKSKIHPTVPKICFWCKIMNINFNHFVIDRKNKLKCPVIRFCSN